MEFDEKSVNVLCYSFMGDAIWTSFVREHIIKNYSGKISAMHSKTTKLINAKTQAMLLDVLREKNLLNENELEIINRARNAKTNSVPKNASLAEYKKSTGFEAVFGYNFFLNKHERNLELFKIVLEISMEKEEKKQ